ncbi:MAG: quinolinate synthase NadA [Puniceicoccales bacterium]|jgi:quinolinate synthase|nr:quinolinate synthase NadA [Puniceicoccales bacterium]
MISTETPLAPLVFQPLDPATPGRPLSAIQEEILRLKRERNAVLLAHNYQVDEIQQIADYVGDSLGLSYKAAETQADVIVFCGVHFMAETAKIVNPSKTVLLPEMDAGCSLSDSCPAEKLAAYKAANPGLYVVAYINCSASVKALCDVICTSGNAMKIVSRVPADREILFVPDQNLGQWVAKKTGRRMRLWPGSCYAHVLYSVRNIEAVKVLYPGAPVVAHPECVEAVRDMADVVCSTEKMIAYCRENQADTFIIVTETGMINRLRREVPGKRFVAGPTDHCGCNDCRFMKMNTIEKVRDSLAGMTPQVELPEAILRDARAPIQRMLDWSR